MFDSIFGCEPNFDGELLFEEDDIGLEDATALGAIGYDVVINVWFQEGL